MRLGVITLSAAALSAAGVLLFRNGRSRDAAGKYPDHGEPAHADVTDSQSRSARSSQTRRSIGKLVVSLAPVAAGAALWLGRLKGSAEKTAVSGQRSLSIDGLRGLGALALLTVHVGMFSGLLGTKAGGGVRPPSNRVGAFLVGGLPSFIGPFFVVPALFLYKPLAKAIIAGQPLPKQGGVFVTRLARLLPGYYAMCAVALAVLNRDALKDLWFMARPFLLAQVYFPNPFVPQFINGLEVTWTVPSMVQWYLALPVIAWLSGKFARSAATPAQRAWRLLLPVPLLAAVGIGWLFLVKWRKWDNRMVFWWPQGFAPTVAVGVLLAVLLALVEVSPSDLSPVLAAAKDHAWLFWLGAVVVFAINCARPFSIIGMDAIYSTPGLLVTYVLVAAFGFLTVTPLVTPHRSISAVESFLGSPVLAWLGKMSYGVYLWHFTMMHVAMQPSALGSTKVRPLRELYAHRGFLFLETFTIIGSLAAAALSRRIIEEPVSRVVRDAVRSRATRTSHPTPA